MNGVDPRYQELLQWTRIPWARQASSAREWVDGTVTLLNLLWLIFYTVPALWQGVLVLVVGFALLSLIRLCCSINMFPLCIYWWLSSYNIIRIKSDRGCARVMLPTDLVKYNCLSKSHLAKKTINLYVRVCILRPSRLSRKRVHPVEPLLHMCGNIIKGCSQGANWIL